MAIKGKRILRYPSGYKTKLEDSKLQKDYKFKENDKVQKRKLTDRINELERFIKKHEEDNKGRMPNKAELKNKLDELSGKVAPIKENVFTDLEKYRNASRADIPGQKVS